MKSPTDALLVLYQLGDEQLDQQPLVIVEGERGLEVDQVWRAVRDDPRLVLADCCVGSDHALVTPGGIVRYHVVARYTSPFLRGLVGSERAMAPLSHLPAGTTLLLRTTAGTDTGSLARDLQRRLFAEGAEVRTSAAALERRLLIARAFFDFFDLLLRIGLAVGVASLAMLSLRAVLERRRAIGVLRALGYRPHHVAFGMLAEALLMVAAAVAIAVVLGLDLVLAESVRMGRAFSPDWGGLLTTAGVLVGVVVVLTLGPAWQASRLRPAEALRIVD